VVAHELTQQNIDDVAAYVQSMENQQTSRKTTP